MKKDDYINSVLSAFVGRNKGQIKAELEAHLADRIERFVEMGYTEGQAEQMAVEKMGDGKIVGAGMTKIHSKKTVTDISFILFFVYVGLTALLSMTILAWGSEVCLLTLGAEYAYFLLSIISLLTANRLKSNVPAMISIVFTLLLLAGKVVFGFHSVLLYGVYFIISGNIDDFIIISQLQNNSITSNLLLAFTILFALLWILSYVFTFINVYRLDKLKYSKKDVLRESSFKKSISAVLIIFTVVTAVLFAFKLSDGYGEYLDGTGDSYYSGVCMIESDEICDIEECYYASESSPEVLYRHLDWGSVDAHTEGFRLYSEYCREEKRDFNNAVTYTFNILRSRYVPSKKYVAAVPVHYEYENSKPCFDNVQWYDTATVKEITGSLDRDADIVKTIDYSVEICNVASLDNVDAAEYAAGVLENLNLGYQYLEDEDIKRIEGATNSTYIGDEGSGIYIYHFVMNDSIDFCIAYPERTVVFSSDDEIISEHKLISGYKQISSLR